MKKTEQQLLDKARVLSNILEVTTRQPLLETIKLYHGSPCGFFSDKILPQFISLYLAEKVGYPLKPGDIVRRRTVRGDSKFGITEVVNINKESDLIVHELCHPQNTCRIYNELFDVLRFIEPELLYYGLEYKLYRWINKAFHKYRRQYFNDRFISDLKFINKEIRIVIECSQIFKKKKLEGVTTIAQPLSLSIPFDKKIKFKTICQYFEKSDIAHKNFIYK